MPTTLKGLGNKRYNSQGTLPNGRRHVRGHNLAETAWFSDVVGVDMLGVGGCHRCRLRGRRRSTGRHRIGHDSRSNADTGDLSYTRANCYSYCHRRPNVHTSKRTNSYTNISPTPTHTTASPDTDAHTDSASIGRLFRRCTRRRGTTHR